MSRRYRCRLLALLLAMSLLLTGCSMDLDRVRSFLFSSDETADTTTDAAADAETAEEEPPSDAAPSETAEAEEAAEETADSFSGDTIQAQQAAVLTLPMESGADLNPFTCDSLANITFFSLIYEGLFTVTPEFTAEPVLCRDYTISDDELTYAFAIRQDVTFSDGTALTAEDVVDSLELARDSEMYAARFTYIDTIEATSTYQVVITLTTPMENLPLLLDIPIVRSGTGSSTSPVGTGPYTLALSGDGAILTQSPNWWQDTERPFRRIELRAFSDGLEQRDMFEQGELDLVVTDPNAVGSATYHSDYELWSQDTTIMWYFGFNMDSPIFSQEEVRSAITYLVDRQTIVSEYANSMTLAAELPVSPNSDLYDTRLAETYSYNPERFRQAISQTDLRDSDGDGILELYGEKMEGTLLVCSDNPQRVAIAQLLADALNAEGFAITVDARSGSDYQTAIYNRNFDMYFAEARLTADFDLTSFFTQDGSLNYGGMTNEEVQELCALSLENSGNFYNLYVKIMDEGLLCPVLFKLRAVYTARGAISGLNPSLSSIFYDLGSISCYGN